ncbi:WD repeat-containing protein 63 [Fundulus heteroclitus]|uniref:WD repeat-containing protein 63 n=1 Tax=Fundulus heteroclitus TaxID=8078 RepID=UPI00165CCFD8|nr:WD repeat-containing protein 63 [Fundulus heteroclitus]
MAPKAQKRSASTAGSKGKEKGKTSQSSTPHQSAGHPDDIFPLVLTSATQELFGCRADEDVTEKSPYKLLQKDDIVLDMRTRAAVSDFSPVKQIVLDYPEEEMLLVFDADFTHGQSFYLVLTPEAKNRILKPPEIEATEVFEAEVNKPPQPKHWISLGSEKEIGEDCLKETREKLKLQLRVDRTFRMPLSFSDHNSADAKDSHVQCAPYQDSRFSIKKLQSDRGTQAVPRLQSKSCQTLRMVPKDTFTQYEPRVFSVEELETILQDESLKNCCATQTPRILHALQQEEIMNVFIDDWKALGTGLEAGDWSGQASDSLVLHQAFADQRFSKDKKISCLNWHPTIYGVVAVALIKKKEKQSEEPALSGPDPALIIFYSFSDPSNPQLLLECPDDILAFEFSPSNPNIIVGGSVNGQVVLWDISAHVTYLQAAHPGSKKASTNPDTFDLKDNKENTTPVARFCAISPVESRHKAQITDVQWLPQTFEVTGMGVPVENTMKVSVQVVSCSPDCTLRFWDVRLPNLLIHTPSDRKQAVAQKTPVATCSVPETFKHLEKTWKPLFRVLMAKINTKGEYAPLKISFEHYICSTEKDPENKWTEILPDYSQLRIPSAEKLKPMEDVNTKLFVGMENGEIVYTDWKLESDESGRPHSAKPLLCFNYHWRVNTMQRSPFFKDIILTTGGPTFAIWKEGVVEGPLVASQYFEHECTAGCWSLSRPAVFFIGKEDGSAEVWDLLKNTSEPLQVHAHISNSKITCMKPWTASAKQHFLALTDDLGVLRVFEIPKTLYVPSKHESLSMKKYFELETESLKNYLKGEDGCTKQNKKMEEVKRQMEPDKPATPPKDNLETTEYSDNLMLEENLLKIRGMWSTAVAR